MTEQEAIDIAIYCLGVQAEQEVCEESGLICKEVAIVAISALKKIRQHWEIGTAEDLKKLAKEENTVKFYYCESEDDYYIGQRVQNMYYAKYDDGSFVWFLSRCLPWGQHVIAPCTQWKEYTYPSEPKEIPLLEWLQGFLRKYCGGTVEKCSKAVEKQTPKDPGKIHGRFSDTYICPVCKYALIHKNETSWFCGKHYNFCPDCGQAIKWDENTEEI